MKKYIIILLCIFSVTLFGAVKTGFTILFTGNAKGDYTNLPSFSKAVSGIEKERKDLIKIDTGSNFTTNKHVNDIFFNYHKNVKYDFNMYGAAEAATGIYNNNFVKYSSINKEGIELKDRYKIIWRNGKSILVCGISDVYEEQRIKGYDFEKEIRNLIYKLGDGVDMVAVVSELRREENIELLKKFKEIDLIFETGRNSIDENYIEYDGRYLVPPGKGGIIYIENEKRAADGETVKTNVIKEQFGTEILKTFGEDTEIDRYARLKEISIENYKKEIIGFNDETFFIKQVYRDDRILFFKKIAEAARLYYNAETAVIPAVIAKEGMQKGLYSREDLQKTIEDDILVRITCKGKEIGEIAELNKTNIETEEYLKFYGLGKFIDDKEYTVITTSALTKNEKIRKILKSNAKLEWLSKRITEFAEEGALR